MSRRLAVVLWALAGLTTTGAVALILTSDHNDDKIATLVFAAPIGLVFVASGIVAWARRPSNRTGLLMVLTGFAWYTGALSEADNSLVFTVGWGFGGLVAWGFFVHLVLAYPSGRLETRLSRALAIAVYALVSIGWVQLLFDDLRDDCPDCPANAFLIRDNASLARAWELCYTILSLAAASALVAVLARRWLTATPATRRVLAPVYVSAAAVFVILAATFAVGTAFESVENALWIVVLVTLTSVPLAFLAGLLRSRLARAGAARLLLDVPDEPTLEEAQAGLRRALGDPTLRLAYWVPEREGYVDVEGKPLDLPEDGAGRATTRIEYEGHPLAALVHDAALREDEPDLLEDVVATARVALEKDRTLRALRATERRSRALLDAIPDNMFRVTRAGAYLDASIKDERYLPVPSADLPNTSVRDVLPGPIADLIMAAVARALDTGEPQTVEYRMQRPIGLRDSEARIVAAGADEVVIIVRDITERKRQEVALQRERDFVAAVVNTAPSFYAVVDLEGRVVRFNDTLAHARGIPDDESVRGLHFWEVFVAEEEAERVASGFRDAGADERALDSEATMATATGERRLVEWWSTPILDEQGDEIHLVCGLDVTERRRQERELQSSRDFLDAVARTTPSLLCVIDHEGRIVADGLNPSAERLSGLASEEAAGRLFWDVFILPEERDAVAGRFAAESPAHSPVEYENEFVGPDGERLVIAWFSAPILDEEGRARFIICNGIDITERKRQEQRLHKERDFLTTVANATPSLLAVVDGEGRVAEEGVNRAFGLATGFGDREARGALFVDLVVAPEDADDARRALAEAFAGSPVREHEHHWVTSAGERLRVAWSVRPLPELRDRALYLVSGMDVTERRRQEEELRRLYDELEQRLQELQASRARIVEAGDAERRRLERNLHDGAQQRLVALSLSLRLAQARLRTDPEGAEQILDGSSAELAQALEELRELARGIHPAVLTDRGLGPALESLAGRVPVPVELAGLPEDRLPRSVEAAAFYVISEALTNVAKYAKATSVSVEVRRENGYALVEVTDDGVGGADPGIGTGLRGLIDRVEALDGRLAIESAPGSGTRVRAEIPLVERPAGADDRTAKRV